MNRTVAFVLVLAVFGAGLVLGMRWESLHPLPGESPAASPPGHPAGAAHTPQAPGKEKKLLFYRHPMNPSITSPRPAKDDMGMDYIPVYEEGGGEGDDDPSVVRIAPALVNNLGVRTEPVTRGTLWRLVETVGYVDYDEHGISHVHLRTEGWIDHLRVRSLGERVRAGDMLFEIYSPQLVSAQAEYVQALAAGDRGVLAASRERLAALGVPDEVLKELEKTRRPRQLVPVYARHGGIVSLLNIREGMYVQPELETMTLADLGSVWVQVDVFERQADWIAVGQKAEMRLPYLPGRAWEGVVEYIYPTVDRKTRTVKARLRFDNPGEHLKPGMYAKATLYGSPREGALSVPREALIESGGTQRVIVAEGEGRFRAVPVKAGMEAGDRIEVLSGLTEGARVVVSSQFMLDSEASVKASFQRMSEPPRAAEPSKEAPAGGGEGTPAAADAIEAMGKLNSVDSAERKVNLTHDPIPAIGWPAMTMDFEVAEGVPLREFRPGERVRFRLKPVGDAYVIQALDPVDRPAGQ